jgi:WD40 repeat protein
MMEDSFHGLTISPDKKFIAATTERLIGIWDADSGNYITTITVPEFRIALLAFSSSGRLLVSDGSEKLKIINLSDVRPAVEEPIIRSLSLVNAIAWSADGQFIVAGSYHGDIEIWSHEKTPLIAIRGHDDEGISV